MAAGFSERRRTVRALGGENEIVVQWHDGSGLGLATVDHAIDAACAELDRIERRYSRYRADSLVGTINACAGGAPVPIDAEAAALFEFADAAHAASEGAFDITSGVLRRAWDFGSGRLPSQAEIDALLPLVDWRAVERGPDRIRLPRHGMEIDLGGIGKEFACDRLAALLSAAGCGHALVNLGGDIRVTGPRADGQPWSVGIHDPHTPAGRPGSRVAASVALHSGALATSGNTARAIVFDGVRYGHLLDARTGWPVQGLASATVAAPLAIVAGIHSSLALLAGPHGLDRLGGLGRDCAWLAIDAAGRLHGPLAS